MIFVLGNICRDTSFYVDRLPIAGETINAKRTIVGLGGKGLNQAVAACRARGDVTLIAAVGADWSTEDENTVRQGSHEFFFSLLHRPGACDSSSVVIAQSGENLIVTNAGQSQALCVADVESQLRLTEGDMLIVQGNLKPDVTCAAMAFAQSAKARVIFNPAPYGHWARSVAEFADVLILNAQESRAWTSEREPLAAIRTIDVPLAIVTLGDGGCLIRAGESEPKAIPAPRVDALDTTGAGDTFVGVFAAEWNVTQDPLRAIRLALAAASASVSKAGTLASIPDRITIDEFRASLQ